MILLAVCSDVLPSVVKVLPVRPHDVHLLVPKCSEREVCRFQRPSIANMHVRIPRLNLVRTRLLVVSGHTWLKAHQGNPVHPRR